MQQAPHSSAAGAQDVLGVSEKASGAGEGEAFRSERSYMAVAEQGTTLGVMARECVGEAGVSWTD
jgi:hypothetical protein